MTNPFRVLIVVSVVLAIALAVGFILVVFVHPYPMYSLTNTVIAPFIS